MSWLFEIPDALRLVPRWCWYLLAIAAGWHFALSWHDAKVKAHDTEIRAESDSIWQGMWDAERASANNWKSKFEADEATISKDKRDIHDAEVRADASVAADLRVRGPGAAAAQAGCRPVDRSAPGAGASGHGDAAAQPDAAGSQVSAGDWALVPWGWLVQRAQEHDDLLSEANAWRSNDQSQRALLDRELKSAPKPAAPVKP